MKSDQIQINREENNPEVARLINRGANNPVVVQQKALPVSPHKPVVSSPEENNRVVVLRTNPDSPVGLR